MNDEMLVGLIESYLTAINKGPTIVNVWLYICKIENAKALH